MSEYIARKLMGERQEGESVMNYTRRRVRIEYYIHNTLLSIFVIIFMLIAGSYICNMPTETSSTSSPKRGYYVAEYINEDGIPVDIDGDGDVFKWVEE